MMNGGAISIFLVLYLKCLVYSVASGGDEACDIDGHSEKAINLILSSQRNQTGNWVTKFSLSKGAPDNDDANNVTLDLSQDITECKGKRMLRIRGVLSGLSLPHIQNGVSNGVNGLLFDSNCGSNVAVLNNGRTAHKINFEESAHSVVFTHRPLKDNEILEVKLEKRNTKFTHCLAIGISTVSPLDLSPYPQHINSIQNRSWAWYIAHAYHNGAVYLKNYGKNIDLIEVGDRAGVMRSSTGSLHFYWNGEDQGPAASNIPHPVYGVVELYGSGNMVSIVDN